MTNIERKRNRRNEEERPAGELQNQGPRRKDNRGRHHSQDSDDGDELRDEQVERRRPRIKEQPREQENSEETEKMPN